MLESDAIMRRGDSFPAVLSALCVVMDFPEVVFGLPAQGIAKVLVQAIVVKLANSGITIELDYCLQLFAE